MQIVFQDGSYFVFLIGMILAIFDLLILPIESTSLSVQEKNKIDSIKKKKNEKKKKDFQDGCHGCQLGFPIGMILAILTCKLP